MKLFDKSLTFEVKNSTICGLAEHTNSNTRRKSFNNISICFFLNLFNNETYIQKNFLNDMQNIYTQN